jgi:DnaJ-class molecular chaperone
MARDCGYCGGTGYSSGEDLGQCEYCGGTGEADY